MIKDVIIKTINKYNDERGWLCEFFRDDEIEYQPAMAYASITKPGVVRGPHEHVRQSDYFVFFGPGTFNLYLWDRREESPTHGQAEILEVGESNPCLVIVPPGVVHGYKCISDHDALSINLPNKLYRGTNKAEEVDEIRWEDKEDSPYRIE